MKERPMDFAELKRAYDENRVIVLPAEYVYELTWDAGPGWLHNAYSLGWTAGVNQLLKELRAEGVEISDV